MQTQTLFFLTLLLGCVAASRDAAVAQTPQTPTTPRQRRIQRILEDSKKETPHGRRLHRLLERHDPNQVIRILDSESAGGVSDFVEAERQVRELLRQKQEADRRRENARGKEHERGRDRDGDAAPKLHSLSPVEPAPRHGAVVPETENAWSHYRAGQDRVVSPDDLLALEKQGRISLFLFHRSPGRTARETILRAVYHNRLIGLERKDFPFARFSSAASTILSENLHPSEVFRLYETVGAVDCGTKFSGDERYWESSLRNAAGPIFLGHHSFSGPSHILACEGYFQEGQGPKQYLVSDDAHPGEYLVFGFADLAGMTSYIHSVRQVEQGKVATFIDKSR